jgi:hypothetical protein
VLSIWRVNFKKSTAGFLDSQLKSVEDDEAAQWTEDSFELPIFPRLLFCFGCLAEFANSACYSSTARYLS